MYHQPPVRPVIESNAAFLSGKARKPKLFLPNPALTLGLMVIFLLTFVGTILLILKPMYAGFRLDRSGVRVNGEVVSVESYNVKHGKRFRVAYTFKDAGGERIGTDEDLRGMEVQGLRKGSPVPVTYLKANGSVSSLGVPGKLWGEKGRSDYLFVLFFAVPLLGYGVWQFVTSAREQTLQGKLLKSGKVIEGEVVSADSSDGSKGKVHTVITYRVPLQDGSVLGKASYVTQGHGKVRRPRAGEKIPVMFVDEESHRPL